MRRIIASAFVTLDGVMQAPGGPEEDVTGTFEEGGGGGKVEHQCEFVELFQNVMLSAAPETPAR